MKRNFDGSALMVVGFLLLVMAACIGWGLNVYKIFSTIGDPVTGAFIARCIGVFVAPIGAILGWF